MPRMYEMHKLQYFGWFSVDPCREEPSKSLADSTWLAIHWLAMKRSRRLRRMRAGEGIALYPVPVHGERGDKKRLFQNH